MKFRFNGGQDCPDWVLAEMNTLSRLTSIKTRLLASKVSENIVMSSTDEELLASAKQLTEDAKFQINDVKAAIAALNFILATSGTTLDIVAYIFNAPHLINATSELKKLF